MFGSALATSGDDRFSMVALETPLSAGAEDKSASAACGSPTTVERFSLSCAVVVLFSSEGTSSSSVLSSLSSMSASSASSFSVSMASAPVSLTASR